MAVFRGQGMSVLYAGVPISVITELEDYIGNHGGLEIGSWEVDIRLYRAHSASFGQDAKNRTLFTIWASHEPERLYVSPTQHVNVDNIDSTESGVLVTPEFRNMLGSKLQSMWQLRQTFKGSGHVFRCEDGGLLRISSILVQSSYKGLLVDADNTPQCGKFVEAMAEFGIKRKSEKRSDEEVLETRIGRYQMVYN